MTRRRAGWSVLGIAWLILVAAWLPASAASTDSVAVVLGPGSTLWLEGTSTLHDFESKTAETEIRIVRGPGVAEPRAAADLAGLMRGAGITGVDVRVPVLSLHSGKAGLDKNLWKTLKADEYPAITFHLERYAQRDSGARGDTISLSAEGMLAVSGQSRPVTLEARAYPGDGGVWLVGRQILRMTTFGIKPPKMMLGTLRVGDQITVHYRLLLMVRGSDSASATTGQPSTERSR
jgi:hypothetical protein